jgi:uncharacterized OB-fold protein
MMERISANPESFASGCLVWIPVAVMVVSLVHWMIMGEIEAGSGIVGITAALLLGFFTLNPPSPLLAPLFLLASVATLILAPITRFWMNRSALSALEVEAIGRAYELLATNPDNFGAKVRLARSLHNKGITAHAIAIAEQALANVPERLFADEHRLLTQWKHQARPGDSPVRIRCVECGVPNFPGTLFCTSCGAPFLLDFAQGKWMRSSTVRRAVAGWLVAILALVGIPTAAVALPPVPAVIAIVVLLVVGVWMLLGAFREPSTELK